MNSEKQIYTGKKLPDYVFIRSERTIHACSGQYVVTKRIVNNVPLLLIKKGASCAYVYVPYLTDDDLYFLWAYGDKEEELETLVKEIPNLTQHVLYTNKLEQDLYRYADR